MNEAIRKLVTLAEAEVGTREEGGNNTGTRIIEYQRATWMTPGPWPWCAAFTCWLMKEWLEDPEVLDMLGIPSDKWAMVQKLRCQDASAFGWRKWALERAKLRPEISIFDETALAKAGDFVIFDFSHIGLVVKDQEPGEETIRTIEGNTHGKPGPNVNDTKDGNDGVWAKSRQRSLTKWYVRLI